MTDTENQTPADDTPVEDQTADTPSDSDSESENGDDERGAGLGERISLEELKE